MRDKVRKVDYYYTMLPRRAGQGAKLLAALAAEGVGMLAMSGFPNGRAVQVDLFPEKAVDLTRAARKLGLKLSKRKTGFLLQGDDRVGAMTRTFAALGAAKIGVIAATGIATGDGRFGAIFWVKPSAVRKAARLLGAR